MTEALKKKAEKLNKQFDIEICKGNCEKCDYNQIKERETCKVLFSYNQGRLDVYTTLGIY